MGQADIWGEEKQHTFNSVNSAALCWFGQLLGSSQGSGHLLLYLVLMETCSTVLSDACASQHRGGMKPEITRCPYRVPVHVQVLCSARLTFPHVLIPYLGREASQEG